MKESQKTYIRLPIVLCRASKVYLPIGGPFSFKVKVRAYERRSAESAPNASWLIGYLRPNRLSQCVPQVISCGACLAQAFGDCANQNLV
jgi:hypothetical protein